MKLAIVNPAGACISGGYRRYLENIVPLLAADARTEALLFISPDSLRAPEWIHASEKIQFAACPPFSLFSRRLARELDRTLAPFCPDIIFVPVARVVRFRAVPVVTMIQNMAPLVSWQWSGLSEKIRLAALWLETYRSVRRAHGVIAISGFVRQFLMKCWRIGPEKIASIHFGAPLPAAAPSRPAPIPYGWTGFIFTAGSIDPYRSLEDIIGCAEHSRKVLRQPLKIVIAGGARKSIRSYEGRLRSMAEKAGVSSDLCWTGHLSAEEMAWCYKNCLAFIMTSRVEAAPVTVLEAMACGAVCIAADNEPLPEFFGEAALYYAPGDWEMLAGRIREVISWDPAKRAQVSAASLERSRKFNWEDSAKQTLDLFELVLKNRRAGAAK